MQSTPDEDDVKIVEMMTRDLEYYINLVDKAVVGFERIDSNFERSSAVGKMLSNSTACYEKSSVKGKVNQWGKHHCCLILRNYHSPLTTLISQQPSSRPSTSKKLQLTEV